MSSAWFCQYRCAYSPLVGVPRILENTLPPHFISGNGEEGDEWAPYEEYLRTTRININVRQVFPRGFDPTLATD